MRNLRILHVAHRMNPPSYGGIEFYVDRVCELHARKGHVVEAWTTLEDDRPRAEVRHGYMVRRFRPLFGLFENPLTISMLPALLRYSKSDPDIIVAHSHLMFTTIFAMLTARLSRTPLVLVSHGYEVRRGRVFDRLLHLYIATISRVIASGSTSIVALTKREASRFLRIGVPQERCVVIPTGVDTDFFRPGRLGVGRKRIVWTGRFVSEKNLAVILKAFTLLRTKMPNVELVLAGDGPERPKLMALSNSLSLDDRVSFPGLISREDISSLLQSAVLYVLPSTAEALPIAILEAMSSGLPSIVSKRLGLEEIVCDSARFADPKDPHEWALTMEELLQDEGIRRRMALRARELAVTRYNWTEIADRLEKLFISIVEGRGIPESLE